jgi:hypothetical protein
MGSRWKKVKCRYCKRDFSIHVDWASPPNKCKTCSLSESNLLDAIDTILRTEHIKMPQMHKDEIQIILEEANAINFQVSINAIEKLLFKTGLETAILYLKSGMNFYQICDILNSLSPNEEQEVGSLSTKIQSLLDPNGIERTVLFREFIADKIVKAPHLYQAVKQAIKVNRRFEKFDASIREKNQERDGLISDGKRRIG